MPRLSKPKYINLKQTASHECPYPQLQGYSHLLGNCKNIEPYLSEFSFILVKLVQIISMY